MSAFPLELGPAHFVGIGGIGMSGIAEVMHNLGHRVRGSDLAEGMNVRRLRKLGIEVAVGHDATHVGNAGVVVTSSAISSDNPELVAAAERRIPVVPRAEMLAELMRFRPSVAVAGTHGKTTTTSMAATVLSEAGFDPTVINGGVVNAYATNARLGTGAWTVVEADESDGTIVRLPATIAVVTGIDPEHLDHYRTFEALRKAFRLFVERIPFYGVGLLCADHPETLRLASTVPARRIVTYGLAEVADVRAVGLRREAGNTCFDVELGPEVPGPANARRIPDFVLGMPGRHSVQNAAAAVAVGLVLGIDPGAIRRGLEGFSGVRRRFTRVGEVRGVTVIDDYGHHPVEIQAALEAAREVTEGRVIAVFQPHRYSRLQALFGDFCRAFGNAAEVIVSDIYPAGETPIEGFDRDVLVDGIRTAGHPGVHALESPDLLARTLAPLVRRGDTVICLGAGDVTAWAADLPAGLSTALEDREGSPS